jgi:N-acyl homoserine lactone hydrolase
MEVRAVTTGRVRGKRAPSGIRRYLADDWSDETLPVHAFLVEHPAGPCLFDTGQTARATAPRWFPWWHPFFRLARFELGPEDEVAAQLARPEEVRLVVLSHLHTDHVGGLDAFAHADVVVLRGEWERARGLRGRVRGYLPQRWPGAVQPRLVDLDGPPFAAFPATHDLLGDGRLLLVPLPGHTPSHAGLLVRDDGRTLLLAGDAKDVPDGDFVVLTAHDDRVPALLERARVAS